MPSKNDKKSDETKDYYHNYGVLYSFFHFIVGPLLLMISTPLLIIFLACVNHELVDTSFSSVLRLVSQKGGIQSFMFYLARKLIPTYFGICTVLGYLAFQVMLMVIVPGPPSYGLLTPTGHLPKYKNNGMSCYLVSMATLGVITWYMKTTTAMSPTIVIDRYDEILAACNVVALTICVLLYFKGRYFPSTSDSGVTGNVLFDYYWGTELFPRIFGIDIKVLTNCRFGMTLWPIVVMLSWLKSYEIFGFRTAMAVSSLSQMMYLTKFFTWEDGYMRTIDIMVDRAGYYICWGCLCYVPGLYTLPSRYFAIRPCLDLSMAPAIGLIALAAFCIIVQQIAEAEKTMARETDGKSGPFGMKPRIIRAKYQLHSGEEKGSILVTSGFWGLSRHFCYFPELLMTFLWSSVDGTASILPYGSPIFLLMLLMHRSYRDDRKCAHKYGKYWEKYMDVVPYRVIPYVW